MMTKNNRRRKSFIIDCIAATYKRREKNIRNISMKSNHCNTISMRAMSGNRDKMFVRMEMSEAAVKRSKDWEIFQINLKFDRRTDRPTE